MAPDRRHGRRRHRPPVSPSSCFDGPRRCYPAGTPTPTPCRPRSSPRCCAPGRSPRRRLVPRQCSLDSTRPKWTCRSVWPCSARSRSRTEPRSSSPSREAGLAGTSRPPPAVEVPLLVHQSWAHTYTGDHRAGEADARRALSVAEEAGDAALTIGALTALLVAVGRGGRFLEALTHARARRRAGRRLTRHEIAPAPSEVLPRPRTLRLRPCGRGTSRIPRPRSTTSSARPGGSPTRWSPMRRRASPSATGTTRCRA